MNPSKIKTIGTILTLLSYSSLIHAEDDLEKKQGGKTYLNEVIVTAEKREQSLQETPIAISVLDESQLNLQGINSLGDFTAGTIPSLRIHPFPNAPSTLIMTIRGNGPVDAAQTTRDAPVAVYLDDVYLSQSQGLDMELVDLERIEVLRGPQGSLFGRNATGGAISLVSKRPSGEFGIKQTLSLGRYDQRSSVTHLDLPEWAGFRTKIDYLHRQQDGWVKNTAPNQADYNEYLKRGGRIAVDWQAKDDLLFSYTYNNGYTEMAQNYYQLYRDDIGVFGAESHRATTTHLPVVPLDPSEVRQRQHTLKAEWTLSDTLTFHSISAYRELDNKSRNNYAGVLYYNGFMEEVDVEQEQLSQEFRLLGNYDRLQWVAGLYGYREQVDESVRNFFSLDIFGDPNLTGMPLTPINPPTNFDAYTLSVIPQRTVVTQVDNIALYGQTTWTPPVLQDKLEITLGLRHSREEKSGARVEGGLASFDLDTTQTDPTLTLNYRWSDNVSTYLKWSNAYRSGGVQSRSVAMVPYSEEEVESFELGLKSEWWEQRARLNAAVFKTYYDDMFIDFLDPADLSISDTINADRTVKIEGLELELTLKPTTKLILGLNYTYLDDDMPEQPNPLAGGALESFELTQTPRHAGSMTLDYHFSPLPIGTLLAHLDVVSSDHYNHLFRGSAHPDAYTLFNGRLVLTDIPLGSRRSGLRVSLWGKNLTDEEYVIHSFNVEGVSAMQTFGEPRTAGIDVSYTF